MPYMVALTSNLPNQNLSTSHHNTAPMSTIQALVEQSTQAIQVVIEMKVLQLTLGHAAWSAA